MRRLIVLLAVLCACQKPQPKPDPIPPDEAAWELYFSSYTRLLGEFREGGWVVSRRPDGSPEHVGDSLIWTGITMYAVPCDVGDEIEAHFLGVLDRHQGGLVRYEPLGEYANGREASLDGALGLYRGIAERIVGCGRGTAWQAALSRHITYINAHGGRLHENTSATLELFYPLLESLAVRAGVTGLDDGGVSTRRAMERAVVGWAWAVQASKAAAFRVHLGWLILTTLERIGHDIREDNRAGFCAATRGMGIPVVENWCGRTDLKDYISGYEFDQWEYRHQRADWESPDGDGDTTPGLDLVVALKEAFAF